MAGLRRDRAVANPEVSDRDYTECIEEFVKNSALHHVLGPRLATALHTVTPNMVVRLCPLIESLIRKGAKNGVIYPTRFEACLRATCPEIPKEYNAAVYIHKATEHLRHTLAMLREMKREEQPCNSHAKRSKTGAFRRSCNSADMIIIKGLLGKMCDDSPSVDTPAPTPLVDDHRIQVPKLSLPSATDLDEEGYPLIFKQSASIMAMISNRSAGSNFSDRPPSMASTAAYDEEGFPILGCPETPVQGIGGDDAHEDEEENDEEDDNVLDPKPKRRKENVIGAKQKGKAQGKDKGKAKTHVEASCAQATPPRKATKVGLEVSPDKIDFLCRPCMSGPTKEDNPRCELVAFETMEDGSKHKVCIWTSRVKNYGKNLPTDMKKIYDAIKQGGMTKQMCLAMKDSFKKHEQ